MWMNRRDVDELLDGRTRLPAPEKRTTLARGGGGEGRLVQPRGVGLNTSERIGLHRYYTRCAHRLQVQHSAFHALICMPQPRVDISGLYPVDRDHQRQHR